MGRSKKTVTANCNFVKSGNRRPMDEGGDAMRIVFGTAKPHVVLPGRNVMSHLEGLGRLVGRRHDRHGRVRNKTAPVGSGTATLRRKRGRGTTLFALGMTLDLGDKRTLVLHDLGGSVSASIGNQHRDRYRAIAFMEASVHPISGSVEFPCGSPRAC